LPKYDLALTERKEEEKEDDMYGRNTKRTEKREIMTATLRPIQR